MSAPAEEEVRALRARLDRAGRRAGAALRVAREVPDPAAAGPATHSPTCWTRHTGCLAALLAGLLKVAPDTAERAAADAVARVRAERGSW